MDWITSAMSSALPPGMARDLQEFVSTITNDTSALLNGEAEQAAQSYEPEADVPAVRPNAANLDQPAHLDERLRLAAAIDRVVRIEELPGWGDEEYQSEVHDTSKQSDTDALAQLRFGDNAAEHSELSVTPQQSLDDSAELGSDVIKSTS